MTAVRARQRELEIPESFEWVHDVTPGMSAAARKADLEVGDYPLMILPDGAQPPPAPLPDGVEIRLLTPEDDLTTIGAIAKLAFSRPGTDAGPEGLADALAEAPPRDEDLQAYEAERIRTGRTVQAAAFVDGEPVAGGRHIPDAGVSEIVGVATLPAFRRRGIAAGLTALLVRDARERGVETVFLTAGSEVIARVYGSQGFVRIGTSGIAEPAQPV